MRVVADITLTSPLLLFSNLLSCNRRWRRTASGWLRAPERTPSVCPNIRGTPLILQTHDQRQRSSADDLVQRWVGSIGLTAAIGFACFLTAKFSVRLILEPSGVAVFWPAAGISSGILIALGPRMRWPVLAGVIVATVVTHLIIDDPLWAGVALGLSNGAEAVITAGLIQYYFGTDFNLVRVRHVVGLLAAAVAADPALAKGVNVAGWPGCVEVLSLPFFTNFL